MSFLQPYIEKGYRRFNYTSDRGMLADDEVKIDCTEEKVQKLVELIFKEEGETLGGIESRLNTNNTNNTKRNKVN